ncbi:MAG: hypothetical protein WBB39_03965 [Candidatus Saccharimonadales bacterium]
MVNGFIEPHVAPRNKPAFSPKLVVIGIVITIILVGSFLFSILGSSSSPTADMDRLNARIDALLEYLDSGDKQAESATMRRFNRDAITLITGNARTVQNSLKSAGAKGKDKTIAARETADEDMEILRTAAVNGQFDDTYRQMLDTKLTSTMELLKTVNGKSSIKAVDDATSSLYESCKAILEQLRSLVL